MLETGVLRMFNLRSAGENIKLGSSVTRGTASENYQHLYIRRSFNNLTQLRLLYLPDLEVPPLPFLFVFVLAIFRYTDTIGSPLLSSVS